MVQLMAEEKSNIKEHLKNPKTTEELYEEIQEEMDWNKDQIKLYLTLDQKVEKDGDKWKVGERSKEEKLLELLRKELSSKQVIKIDKFVGDLPIDLVFGPDDILRLVKKTDDLKCPNERVVTNK